MIPEEKNTTNYPDRAVVEPGRVAELLDRYPNMYADLSAYSCHRALTRDLSYARQLLIGSSHKLMFGTDRFLKGCREDPVTIALIRKLDLPEEVEHAILRGNAQRMLGLWGGGAWCRSEGWGRLRGTRSAAQGAYRVKEGLLVIVPFLLLVAVHAHALVVAEGGQARATIVLGLEPSPAEQTAARELSEYLQKITGATFPIVADLEAVQGSRLLVGPSDEARRLLGTQVVDSLGPEGFIVRTIGGNLLLVGGRPRGTLYAVYWFLEDELGCRWMTSYAEEDITRRETLAVVGLDRREKPAMPVQDIVGHTNNVSDRSLMQRFLVRNRCQGPDLNFTGDVSAFGGTSQVYGFPTGGWMAHALFNWIPPQEHFAAHPDWFSLAGDKRAESRQLCFTNPGLREALTASILKRIGEDSPAATYSVSAMDWTGRRRLLLMTLSVSPGFGTSG